MPILLPQGRASLLECSGPQHLCPGGCLVSSCASPTLSQATWALFFKLELHSPLSEEISLLTYHLLLSQSGGQHGVLFSVIGFCSISCCQLTRPSLAHADCSGGLDRPAPMPVRPGSWPIPAAHCQEVTFLAGPLGGGRFCENGLCSRLMS